MPSPSEKTTQPTRESSRNVWRRNKINK